MHDDLDTFLAYHAATDWSPRTVTHRRSHLAALMRYLRRKGHRRWATIAAVDLDRYLLDLQAKGLARVSRDAHAWAIRGLFAWLIERGKVLVDPALDLAVLDDDEIPLPPAPLSEDQVARIFAVLPALNVIHLRNRLILELLYSCGVRNQEAIDLDLADVDLIARTVLVRAGLSDRPRLLPMMGGMFAVARDYLAVRRELLRGPDHGALLLGERGRRLHPLAPGALLRAVSREVGFRVHPHLLRHSIAVHLLRRGTDIRMIQEFLGHADLDTTKVYLRLVPGQLRKDYDAAMPQMPVGP